MFDASNDRYREAVLELLKDGKGMESAKLRTECRYNKSQNAFLKVLYSLKDKRKAYQKDGKWYAGIDPTWVEPKPENIAVPRSFTWKPLVHALIAPRPTYSGADGVTIRSRMNSAEFETLYA